MVNGMKLGLAINSKLNDTNNKERIRLKYPDIIDVLLESVRGSGQFTVVEWSVLGKQLEIFGSGKE